jgi:DNA gyrase/topoisomerase IV subunit B
MSINPAENTRSNLMKYDGAKASWEVHPVVQNAVSEAFAAWLATHPNDAKAILQKIAAGALARISSE